MAFLAIVALLGLSAFNSAVADPTCIAEGSSAVSSLINDLSVNVLGGRPIAPSVQGGNNVCPPSTSGRVTFCYQANGSGAGRTWARTGRGALAFGDASYSGAQVNSLGSPRPVYKNGPKPASVSEFPIAIGAIAIYRNNFPGIPATACLTIPMMCRIFSQNPPNSWKDLNPSWPNVPLRTVIRSDSSGSTDALKQFLNFVCQDARYAIPNWSGFPSPGVNGVLGAERTSGVRGLTASTLGAVTYLVCNPYGTAAQPTPRVITEMAVMNQRLNCVKCNQCATNQPSAAAQCGIYSMFQIQTRACDWTGVQPNGDKDGDNDQVIDLDNDQDGVGLYDYPTVFLEFAMMPTVVPAGQKECCKLYQRLIVFLLNDNTQARFPAYGFFKMPRNILAAACKCMSGRKCGIPFAGTYTPAGACV